MDEAGSSGREPHFWRRITKLTVLFDSGVNSAESGQTVAVTQSEVPEAIPTVPAEPPALARSIARELVTRYQLRPVDQRDSRLGGIAGQYELAMAVDRQPGCISRLLQTHGESVRSLRRSGSALPRRARMGG
ncbi:MAG TPA: hypothetical protein VND96_09120 [Candidatus Micrarchaeaceae archaeon]|nr:hypothetical protein [Candidatus Micrarchaeaceae archaeon]